jgi:AraC family transcriptional regulator
MPLHRPGATEPDVRERFAARHRRNGRAYGSHLADCFRLPDPPSHVARTLRRGLLAVTELRLDFPMLEPTAPFGYDDAFLVTVQIEDVPDHEYWVDGQAIVVEPLRAGAAYIHDLRQNPRVLLRQPAHALHFYLPLATLNAFADEQGRPAISDLIYQPGSGEDDALMRHVAQAVLAALDDPRGAHRLFLDQCLDAVCAHTLERYGVACAAMRPSAGRLARWQEERSKEMMDQGLAGNVSLAELARECRLSVTHFVRAFHRSTGLSPHQWLLARRIDRARSFLTATEFTLAEVALACGFSDQSHLTRVFTASVGTSPGRWRRFRQQDPHVRSFEAPGKPSRSDCPAA